MSRWFTDEPAVRNPGWTIAEIARVLEVETPETPVEEWRERGACLGMPTHMFFPEQRRHAPRAQQVCNTCPVQVECLQHAMNQREEHGMWGGKSETQRDWMRRKRNQTFRRIDIAG